MQSELFPKNITVENTYRSELLGTSRNFRSRTHSDEWGESSLIWEIIDSTRRLVLMTGKKWIGSGHEDDRHRNYKWLKLRNQNLNSSNNWAIHRHILMKNIHYSRLFYSLCMNLQGDIMWDFWRVDQDASCTPSFIFWPVSHYERLSPIKPPISK